MSVERIWQAIAETEALEDIELAKPLVNRSAQSVKTREAINFYTPTFKSFQTSEVSVCGKNAWPAVSITGARCKLQCDHCKAKILEPMIPAETPEALWALANRLIAEEGAQGMLLTGGSNHRNEVEYGPFLETIRRIKDSYPHFRFAVHTALMDHDQARSLEQAGVDVAMMDVIGAQETITQVYHLKRSVEDFEATLEALVATEMKIVPHIVAGLHFGELLGEWNALEMVARHLPDALVLVVVNPIYANPRRPFKTPDPEAVGEYMLELAERLPEDFPLLLGCARPAGEVKTRLDSYAVLAGFSGIAHPADGMVELAVRLGKRVQVTPSCCSITIGEEVLGEETAGFTVDIQRLMEEKGQAPARGRPIPIPVVAVN